MGNKYTVYVKDTAGNYEEFIGTSGVHFEHGGVLIIRRADQTIFAISPGYWVECYEEEEDGD